jgi:hypothetical protein
MQILNTGYSISPKNWTSRTPFILKFVCDILLFLSLVAANLPEIANPVVGKWILTGGVIAKLLSNFISEHIPAQQVSDPEEAQVN